MSAQDEKKEGSAELKMKFHLCCKTFVPRDTGHEPDNHEDSQEYYVGHIFPIFGNDCLLLSSLLVVIK